MKKTKWPSYKSIKTGIMTAPDMEAKALFAYLYAGISRVGEITRPDSNKAPERKGEPSISKKDVEYRKTDDGTFLFLHLSSQKGGFEREVPLNPRKEEWLCELVYGWKEACMTEELFPYSTRWAFNKVSKHLGFNPHVFRHARATHYLTGSVTGKPMSLEHVRVLGGWKRVATLQKFYSGVTLQDVLVQL